MGTSWFVFTAPLVPNILNVFKIFGVPLFESANYDFKKQPLKSVLPKTCSGSFKKQK